jgi:hypothetical protein
VVIGTGCDAGGGGGGGCAEIVVPPLLYILRLRPPDMNGIFLRDNVPCGIFPDKTAGAPGTVGSKLDKLPTPDLFAKVLVHCSFPFPKLDVTQFEASPPRILCFLVLDLDLCII